MSPANTHLYNCCSGWILLNRIPLSSGSADGVLLDVVLYSAVNLIAGAPCDVATQLCAPFVVATSYALKQPALDQPDYLDVG